MADGKTVMAARTESLPGLVLHEEQLLAFLIDQGGGNRRTVSRRFRFVLEPPNLMCPIDRSADYLDGRPYLLLRRQPVPGQNSFLQCGAISLNAGSVVEGRGLPGIDIDFVIATHQHSQRPGVRYLLGDEFVACGTMFGRFRGEHPRP